MTCDQTSPTFLFIKALHVAASPIIRASLVLCFLKWLVTWTLTLTFICATSQGIDVLGDNVISMHNLVLPKFPSRTKVHFFMIKILLFSQGSLDTNYSISLTIIERIRKCVPLRLGW